MTKRAARRSNRPLESGINCFDTADMYSLGASEEMLGRALKDFGPIRDKVVIARKFFTRSATIRTSADFPESTLCTRSTTICGVSEPITWDLYQIYRFDPETPINETLEALDDVGCAGKALYLGGSSMAAWQFAKMLNTG